MVLTVAQPTAGMKCIQQILLAFNAIFTFTGFILISIGSMVNNINTDYAQFIEARFFSPSVSIIGIGCLVFVIALFGCYGAYKLSVAAITVFYVLLASVFVLELGVGLVGYTLQSQIGHMLVTTLNSTLFEYGTDPIATDAIDDLQYGVNKCRHSSSLARTMRCVSAFNAGSVNVIPSYFFCCGIRGPDDWSGVIQPTQSDIIMPASCCAFYDGSECIAIKKVGCLSQLQFLIAQSSLLLISTVLLIALMQLLGVIFAYKLARELRQQKSLRDRLLWEVKENVVGDENPAFLAEYFRLPSYSELFSNHNEKN